MIKEIDFSKLEGLKERFAPSANNKPYLSFESKNERVEYNETKVHIEEERVIKPQPHDRERFQAAKTAAQDIAPLGKCPHFRFDRSKTGKELAEALKESLRHHGINPDDVMVRYFSNHAIGNLISTGTDRDRTSKTGNRDGEETWMRALGIWGAEDVTYAAPLRDHLVGGADSKSHNLSYVIYDKRLLYKVSHQSNGFHAFLKHPSQACIGIMSDQGNIELSKPAAPSATAAPAPP